MRKQLDSEGKIIEKNSILLKKSEIKDFSHQLFTQFNWEVESYIETNNGIEVKLRNIYLDEVEFFYYFPATIRDESRNKYEKKIQLGGKDPLKYKKEDVIILGFYISKNSPSIEDIIFVAYPVNENMNYETNPSIRKTFIDGILQKAKLNGLYVDKESKYVGFTNQFFMYYLKNRSNLHGYETIYSCDNNYLEEQESINSINKPHQRIFFGAPGTGKSFKLNKEAKENFGNNYERVTFHPNYMYGNFIGAFKPFPKVLKDNKGNILKDENGNIQETITYKYTPGPLMRVLVEALKNREKNYLLLIEEINRANVSAVFGDFFQLLDRDENGESEYPITTSEEVRMYLDLELENIDDDTREYINNKIGIEYERLILPNNLYIWSTMNSADQGVMPMDTAFKRRWEFTYTGIDDVLNNPEIVDEFESYRFKISEKSTIKWNDFRVEVNKRLSNCGVPEDKLLGPYFISKSVLESRDVDKITENVKNKVLMYLYDDAGKPYRNNLFVAEKSRTYSELCRNFDINGKTIFKRPLDIEDNDENI